MLMEALVPVMLPSMTQCRHGMLTFHTHLFTHGVTFHLRWSNFSPHGRVISLLVPLPSPPTSPPLKAALMHCNFTLAEGALSVILGALLLSASAMVSTPPPYLSAAEARREK